MLRKILISLALTVLMHTAGASSVSYILDQSNTLPDLVDYLKVTIDDEGAVGDINFTVETYPTFTEGGNFGIQSFSFNGLSLISDNITGLPSGWRFHSDRNLSEFGVFTNYLTGRGSSRLDTLTFSISGISFDDITSYVELSMGENKNLNYFSSHVAGFSTPDPTVTSAWFGGSTSAVVVPLPAAVWLFGSGLLGLMGLGYRKKNV